jgi:putative phosphoesterase
MKLLLVSDSHGATAYVNMLILQMKKEGVPDAVLYAGDGIADADLLSVIAPVHKVRGNCDPPLRYVAQELTLRFGPSLIYLSHGNLHRVKRSLDLLASAAIEAGAGIVVYGHTHRQKLDLIDRVYLVNPGALFIGEYALLHLQPDGSPRIEFRNLN